MSGSTFILWVIVFYFDPITNNFNDQHIYLTHNLKVIAGLVVVALPVGVIIHQFSVLIKNQLIARIWNEFNDFPNKEIILTLKKETKLSEYCLDRISNLNSFYYVRFDNGFLSPLLAWFTVSCLMGNTISFQLALSALIIGLITVAYLPRIYLEIKKYHNILKSIKTN